MSDNTRLNTEKIPEPVWFPVIRKAPEEIWLLFTGAFTLAWTAGPLYLDTNRFYLDGLVFLHHLLFMEYAWWSFFCRVLEFLPGFCGSDVAGLRAWNRSYSIKHTTWYFCWTGRVWYYPRIAGRQHFLDLDCTCIRRILETSFLWRRNVWIFWSFSVAGNPGFFLGTGWWRNRINGMQKLQQEIPGVVV